MLHIWDNKVRSPITIVALHGLLQRVIDPTLPVAERLRLVNGQVYRDWLEMTQLAQVCYPHNWRLVCPSPSSLNWTTAHDSPLTDLLEEERALGAETLVVLGFSDGATTAARLVEAQASRMQLGQQMLLICHSGLRPKRWSPVNKEARRLYVVSSVDPFRQVVEETGEMCEEAREAGLRADHWTQDGTHPTGWKGRFRGHWFSPVTTARAADWILEQRSSTLVL